MASRFLIVVACLAVAACSSSSLEHPVQPPGSPAVSGLQVPPDAWARPTQQTASLPSR